MKNPSLLLSLQRFFSTAQLQDSPFTIHSIGIPQGDVEEVIRIINSDINAARFLTLDRLHEQFHQRNMKNEE